MLGEDEPVLVSVEDGVARITLNRPARLNALNAPMMFGLLEAVRSAMSDGRVRVLLITGAGRGFCAGGDVNRLGDVIGTGPLAEQAARLRGVARIVEAIYEGPKPVIAAINGACAGAGLGIAAAADLRIAADHAVFNTAFLAIGVSGDFGGTWLLSRVLGPAKAKQLYLECEKFDAASALEIGLVNNVVPADELMDTAGRLAARIAAFSPAAVSAVKANFRDAAVSDLASSLDTESLRQVQTQSTPESKLAVEQFVTARTR